MNKWRITVIFLISISLVIIICSSIIQWNSLLSIPQIGGFHPGRLFPDPRNTTPGFIKTLASFFAMFLSGVIILYLFPRHVIKMSAGFDRPSELIRQGLLGFLAHILAAIGIISATLSILSAPLAIGLFVLVFLTGFAGVIAFSLNIGSWLLSRTEWLGYPHPLSIGLGLIILFALSNLPFIGIFFIISFACIGLGAAISSRFGNDQSWNINSIVGEERE
jgi:type IV secretory pathway VirB2 component (pilin)